jgi:catechol 2,3-dioxygenase-like lactoylglutathione lyase family enzyme
MPGMVVHGIAHVQIPIPIGREDAARSFYGAALGMPEIPKPDSLSDRGGVWFECGQQEVHCGVAASDTRRHPALLTDVVDSLRVQLERAGFEVVVDREIPGYRRFYTRDPFGNRIELTQPD